ncbi:hypothetical protein [Subtercola frigoramans]|uniref:Molybdopterin converting factor small subunit n=1 Tax=Subtercola frigoramans TaxID=120298 RepID=A0ABS2L6X8_9MICO|nr:hypothetical protein [Subtercola frigoramans]MBM7472857.1 molybdopterin converting factor small subunit [Subtercola frigoramans]
MAEVAQVAEASMVPVVAPSAGLTPGAGLTQGAEVTLGAEVPVDTRGGVPVVTVRYFAAAKAAAGAGEEVRPLPGLGSGCSIQALLDSTPFGSAPVFARSTFLLNGVTTTDRAALVHPGDTLDVLPPFAGG